MKARCANRIRLLCAIACLLIPDQTKAYPQPYMQPVIPKFQNYSDYASDIKEYANIKGIPNIPEMEPKATNTAPSNRELSDGVHGSNRNKDGADSGTGMGRMGGGSSRVKDIVGEGGFTGIPGVGEPFAAGNAGGILGEPAFGIEGAGTGNIDDKLGPTGGGSTGGYLNVDGPEDGLNFYGIDDEGFDAGNIDDTFGPDGGGGQGVASAAIGMGKMSGAGGRMVTANTMSSDLDGVFREDEHAGGGEGSADRLPLSGSVDGFAGDGSGGGDTSFDWTAGNIGGMFSREGKGANFVADGLRGEYGMLGIGTGAVDGQINRDGSTVNGAEGIPDFSRMSNG